jgi:hypothetical protein
VIQRRRSTTIRLAKQRDRLTEVLQGNRRIVVRTVIADDHLIRGKRLVERRRDGVSDRMGCVEARDQDRHRWLWPTIDNLTDRGNEGIPHVAYPRIADRRTR